MFLPVTQPNVIVLVLPQHCSFMYEQCCNTARLYTSSVFPSKLKLNTDPEAEPYGIHQLGRHQSRSKEVLGSIPTGGFFCRIHFALLCVSSDFHRCFCYQNFDRHHFLVYWTALFLMAFACMTCDRRVLVMCLLHLDPKPFQAPLNRLLLPGAMSRQYNWLLTAWLCTDKN